MILVAGAASVAPSSPAVMANLVTWTSQNGYSSIQWNVLTEITIFHVYPIANGSIVYDGSAVNVPSVIATAHSHNVKVCLAVGGSGSPAWNYNSKIVNSPSLRAALANNIAAEVSKEGYDCVHWDFENNVAGDFSAKNYTLLIQQSRQVLPSGITIDCTFAPWETSVNVTAIAPYCNNLMYMFNPSVSQLNAYASVLGGSSTAKLMAGYDLSSADGSAYHVPTSAELAAMKNAGYGIFIWNIEYLNASFYTEISQAYPIGTATTTSASTTTTTTSPTSSTSPTTTAPTTTSTSTTTTTTSLKPPTSVSSTSITTIASTTTVNQGSASFSLGDNIITIYPTNLWASPAIGATVGTVPIGELGIIVSNAQYDANTTLWFYKTTFQNGLTGWVKEKQIALVVSPLTSITSTTTSISTSTSIPTTTVQILITSTSIPVTTSTVATTAPTTISTTLPTSSTSSSLITTTTVRSTPVSNSIKGSYQTPPVRGRAPYAYMDVFLIVAVISIVTTSNYVTKFTRPKHRIHKNTIRRRRGKNSRPKSRTGRRLVGSLR